MKNQRFLQDHWQARRYVTQLTPLNEELLVETSPKTKSKTDAPEQFREMIEKGATQSKEAFEKMSAATSQAADVMKNCCSTAVKGAQDYNNKLIEFTPSQYQSCLQLCPKDVWREIAFGVRRTFDRALTAAVCDADRADQTTRGACPAGDARDCGAI